MIKKRAAGRQLLTEDASLAHAGVHEQTKGEGEIRFLGEIGDGLGLGVLFEGEVVFGEIADDVAVFVADGGEEIDGGDVEGDGRGLLGEKGNGGEEEKERC